MKLMTPSEFKVHALDNPIDWTVEGLFMGASFNLVAGGPKSGKSTLLRQMLVAVSKGETFLGRTTKKSQVAFICPDEPNSTQLSISLEKLGAEDGGVFISNAPVDRNKLAENVKDALLEHPGIRVIVLDTLERVVEFRDLNSYSETVADLDPLVNLATDYKLTIIAIHHVNKRHSATVAGSLMGSNGLGSVATTTIEVVKEGDDKRFIRSMQRYGREIEKTELLFDHESSNAFLGKSSTEQREDKASFKTQDAEKRILEFVSSKPGALRQEIQNAVELSTGKLIAQLHTMIDSGLLRAEGEGKKGSPKLYFPHIPQEKVAA